MVDIESIIEKPYEQIRIPLNKNIFKGVIKCIYKKEFDSFKIEIECSVEEEKYYHGSVEMIIAIGELTQSGAVGFGYLSVPLRIRNRGIGTFLMSMVLEIAIDFIKHYNPTVHIVDIKGWLSSEDYHNGNWNNSLPFYQRIARINNIDIVFRGRGSKQEYADWKDYMKHEAGKEGDVIYRVANRVCEDKSVNTDLL